MQIDICTWVRHPTFVRLSLCVFSKLVHTIEHLRDMYAYSCVMCVFVCMYQVCVYIHVFSYAYMHKVITFVRLSPWVFG